MIEKIIISGVGGQGVMMTGKLLCYAAIDSGKYATFLPEYGAQQRGGPARCTVILSDAPVNSPVAGITDTLIAFDQASVDEFLPRVKEGGKAFVNASLCHVDTLPAGVQLVSLPVDNIADDMGARQVANLIMLGAYLAVSNIVSQEEMNRAIAHSLGGGKGAMIPRSEAAVAEGIRLAEQEMAKRISQ